MVDKYSSKEQIVDELTRISSELICISIALHDWVGDLNSDHGKSDDPAPEVPFTRPWMDSNIKLPSICIQCNEKAEITVDGVPYCIEHGTKERDSKRRSHNFVVSNIK